MSASHDKSEAKVCPWSHRIGYDCELPEGHGGSHVATDLDGKSKVGWAPGRDGEYKRRKPPTETSFLHHAVRNSTQYSEGWRDICQELLDVRARVVDLETALAEIRDNCPGSAAIMARAALGEHRYVELATHRDPEAP